LTLAATTRPVIGTNWDLALTNRALLDLIIFSTTDPNIADLGFLGMPGCGLRANLDVVVTGPTASLAIPNVAALAGFNVFVNGASVAPGANSFGFLTSNGIQGVVGNF
jgi:hypothetical protein